VRGSLLPARAMRVRAYICVRIYAGNAYARSNEKRKCIHRTKKKKLHFRVEGDSRASTPLPPYSIGRLIFYSGRSRICICSGVPYPSPLSFYLRLSSSLGTCASVWDIIRMILQSGERKVHLDSTCTFQF
jgi:hypothetical protein